MQHRLARFKLAANSPDLLIEIPKDSCTIYEFERDRELSEIGRRTAEQTLAAARI
jgi:NTE family protein